MSWLSSCVTSRYPHLEEDLSSTWIGKKFSNLVSTIQPKMVQKWGAGIAQWIRLHLLTCRPAFESRAFHLRFYRFIIVSCRKGENKRERGRDWPIFKKVKKWCKIFCNLFKAVRVWMRIGSDHCQTTLDVTIKHWKQKCTEGNFRVGQNAWMDIK